MIDNTVIIEKIRALMAKANDSAATEAEAEAFMKKALELLAKHNLEEKDLQIEDVEINIEETEFKVLADLSWFSKLAYQVAEMYFCRTLTRSKYELGRKSASHYYVFVGKEHNRLMAVHMFAYLMKTMHRLARNHSDNVKNQYEFKKGCATRLAFRIYQINQSNKKEDNSQGLTGLPALYNQELALIDDHMSGMKLKDRNKTSLKVGNSAFYEGAKAANTISLNNQITSPQTSKFLLK